MAGNTRGKLKEKFESIHRNFEWIKKHLNESVVMIQDHKPNLSESIKMLGNGIEIFDELAQDIYARL